MDDCHVRMLMMWVGGFLLRPLISDLFMTIIRFIKKQLRNDHAN